MYEKKYEVLKHFRWGDLLLETGQRIVISKTTQDQSLVQIYGTDKIVRVHSESVLGKIEANKLREI